MSDIHEELIDLQIRLAYQEDTIAQLNLVVTKQDADLVQLQQQVRLLVKRIDELSFAQGSDSEILDSERPPHY